MGLFSSIFGGSKSGTVSPEEFYKQCVEATHESLKKLGYANRGVIFIPELMAMGKEAILKDLQNPMYTAIVGGDPKEYYEFISTLAFMAGVAFADKWHHNYDELKNGYKDKVIKEGSSFFGGPILKNAFDLEDDTDLNKMCVGVFHAWFTLHEPYWAMEDPRQYTFNGLLAAYQAGISTILEKYGY